MCKAAHTVSRSLGVADHFTDYRHLNCTKIHISYQGSSSMGLPKSQHRSEDFFTTSFSYRLFDYSWDGDFLLEPCRLLLGEISELSIQLPNFCTSLSQRGPQVFKHYIGQHLDSRSCLVATSRNYDTYYTLFHARQQAGD
jgi:hypothetical protein